MLKYLVFLFTALIAVVIVPVGIKQVRPDESRQLEVVRLAETTYQEINFHNDEQNLDLGGMLFIPEGDGPFPAAVMIHGAGSSKRDNGWYLSAADYLQKSGIVVLLPDKRGSEQSEGDWHTSSLEDLATDTMAAVNYLKTQDDVPVASIGLIGMSQGGHVAPIVATQSDDIVYIVSVVSSALPLHETIRYEENHNLREMGFLPGISNAIAYFSTAYWRNVSQKEFWDSVGNFDPLPYWEGTAVPVLVLYGKADTNVPTARSLERYEEMGHDNIQVVVYAGSGHPLEDPEGQGNRLFRLDALEAIRDHILTTAHAV